MFGRWRKWAVSWENDGYHPSTEFILVKSKIVGAVCIICQQKKMWNVHSKSNENSIKSEKKNNFKRWARSPRISSAQNSNAKKKRENWMVVAAVMLLLPPSLQLNNPSALSFLVQVSHFSFIWILDYLLRSCAFDANSRCECNGAQWCSYVHVFILQWNLKRHFYSEHFFFSYVRRNS